MEFILKQVRSQADSRNHEVLARIAEMGSFFGIFQVDGSELRLSADTEEEFFVLQAFSIHQKYIRRSVAGVAKEVGIEESKVKSIAWKYCEQKVLESVVVSLHGMLHGGVEMFSNVQRNKDRISRAVDLCLDCDNPGFSAFPCDDGPPSY